MRRRQRGKNGAVLSKLVTAADLSRRVTKLTSILEVAKVLNAARDLETLLQTIVREACSVVESDRCSLFILDRETDELWSKVAKGSTPIRLAKGSGIAGQVAATGKVINLTDAYADPRFNPTFDQLSGYRTRTILCVPMRDAAGAVTGVIQALNKHEGGFNDEDEELLLALGGQAAGALENAVLQGEIAELFEGFVNASVLAIEARDPSTAGHSGRVASLTLALAQSLEQVPSGPYRGLTFTDQDIQEMRYASLPHDFGKVGVRENVLIKAEKLYPHDLEILKSRFEIARKDRQLRSYQKRLERVRLEGERNLPTIEGEEAGLLVASLLELEEIFQFVLACNRPTVLVRHGFERLLEVSQSSFEDSRGEMRPLLTPHEVELLSIPKGSLSSEERREIESHVTHTYRFLMQIPWTRALRRVPEIAYAHHERVGGTGYPRALANAAIPLQSKMMAVSDVYDALTASDRPYKKAVPHALALDILQKEVQAGSLDGELLRVFIEANIPERANIKTS